MLCVWQVICAVAVLIVSMFMVYEVRLILNGDHKFEFYVDDYMFAAMNLHFDVMNVVAYLLVVKFARSNVCKYILVPLALYVSIVYVYILMLVGN